MNGLRAGGSERDVWDRTPPTLQCWHRSGASHAQNVHKSPDKCGHAHSRSMVVPHSMRRPDALGRSRTVAILYGRGED